MDNFQLKDIFDIIDEIPEVEYDDNFLLSVMKNAILEEPPLTEKVLFYDKISYEPWGICLGANIRNKDILWVKLPNDLVDG